MITLLYEKTLKQSKVDEKTDEKETEELKKISNQYIDKGKEIMKSSSFEAEDVFGDVISEDNFGQQQITKPNFFSQNDVNMNKNIRFNIFEPRKKNDIDYQPSAPPEYSDF